MIILCNLILELEWASSLKANVFLEAYKMRFHMNVFMVTCGVGEYFLTELNELLLPRVIGKNSFMNYCYKL